MTNQPAITYNSESLLKQAQITTNNYCKLLNQFTLRRQANQVDNFSGLKAKTQLINNVDNVLAQIESGQISPVKGCNALITLLLINKNKLIEEYDLRYFRDMTELLIIASDYSDKIIVNELEIVLGSC